VIVRYPTNGLNAPPSYVDTSAMDTFAVATGSFAGADVDANTTLTYGISGGTTASGVVSKVGTYGTLAITASTGAYNFTPNAAAINALSIAATETFTVTVSDGTETNTASLVINLAGVNEAPTISTISAQSTTEDTPTSPIAFTVGDVETAAGSLTVTATSSPKQPRHAVSAD
jgi:VCBS repeat-containing protein